MTDRNTGFTIFWPTLRFLPARNPMTSCDKRQVPDFHSFNRKRGLADDEEIYELCQQVKENYNYKRKDNKEEVQEEDERY